MITGIEIYGIFKQAIMITGFVFVMMLVIEYINVQTQGLWTKGLKKNSWNQYLIAALLGAIPGCLGAFTAVAMFSHKLISFGAIVTAMIATSGDEAFVMFGMFPGKAAVITLVLLGIGIFAGFLTDKLYKPKKCLASFANRDFPLHKQDTCKCFQKDLFLPQLRHPSVYRIALLLIILALLTAILTGWIAGEAKLWIKATLTLATAFTMFIVISVPEHFLTQHLWDHIVKKHILRIFLWTFGTLLVVGILMHYVDVHTWLSDNMFLVLLIAIAVGIIPESGPHLVFVTLFAQGSIPFSILLASSIVQDGHGMLPLLAESPRSFLSVKIVNIIFALVIGTASILLGF
ncbi:MAG: putative manganese transporter [Bacteroidota bacterium]|nr:putative manganese transporter [Bacteroidota bacterium]